jgi:hypothetical protein
MVGGQGPPIIFSMFPHLKPQYSIRSVGNSECQICTTAIENGYPRLSMLKKGSGHVRNA